MDQLLMNYTIRKRGHQADARLEDEGARLEAEWIASRREKDALQAELYHPTISRLYDTQIEIVRKSRAVGARCHDLLVQLRSCRRSLRARSN
jgi:hypothetical protein